MMFITILYKDSCNFHRSLAESARHASCDKEVMITIGMILCEPGYSPGSNCNVHSILKKKERNKKIKMSEIDQLEPIKMTLFIPQSMVLYPGVEKMVCELFRSL